MTTTFSSRLGGFLKSSAVLGIASVFALKGSTVILGFALITLAARALGEAAFGTFSVLFSAAGLLSIVASLGQQLLLMRSWNEYAAADDPARLKGALIFGTSAFALGSSVVAAGLFAVLALYFPAGLVASTVVYMVALGLVLTTAHVVRTAVGVGIGDGVGNILSIVFPIGYLLFCLLGGGEAEISMVFWMFSTGAGLSVGIHFFVLHRKLVSIYPAFSQVRPQFEVRGWAARSYRLWFANGLEAANQYLDVLIVGILMSPTIAGGYFVTTRLANAFATASDAMNMFSTRHIPDLHFRGETRRLAQMLDSVAVITLAVVVGGMVVMLGFGPQLLGVFSPAYVQYYPALALLCVGTGALAAVGSSASILMLTGHEGSYLRIIALSVVTRAVGFFLLVPLLDVMGAVVATVVASLGMAIMLRVSARSLAGVDGSILRLLPPPIGDARAAK